MTFARAITTSPHCGFISECGDNINTVVVNDVIDGVATLLRTGKNTGSYTGYSIGFSPPQNYPLCGLISGIQKNFTRPIIKYLPFEVFPGFTHLYIVTAFKIARLKFPGQAIERTNNITYDLHDCNLDFVLRIGRFFYDLNKFLAVNPPINPPFTQIPFPEEINVATIEVQIPQGIRDQANANDSTIAFLKIRPRYPDYSGTETIHNFITPKGQKLYWDGVNNVIIKQFRKNAL